MTDGLADQNAQLRELEDKPGVFELRSDAFVGDRVLLVPVPGGIACVGAQEDCDAMRESFPDAFSRFVVASKGAPVTLRLLA